VIRRIFGEVQPEKIPHRQRIRRAPGDAALGIDAFEVADQQQPKKVPDGDPGRPHPVRLEPGTLRFHEVIEFVFARHLVQPPIKWVTRGPSANGSLRHIVGCRARLPVPIDSSEA